MKKKIVLFLSAFLMWCLLNWVPDWEHAVVGILAAGFVAFMTGDLFLQRPGALKNPRRYFYFVFWYLPVFLWEVIKTNVDVARRVLQPSLPINPGIVRVQTSLRSDAALTFLANSITLTPGTMVVDIDKEKSLLYVHWIDVKAVDAETATKLVVERFEKILRKIFD